MPLIAAVVAAVVVPVGFALSLESPQSQMVRAARPAATVMAAPAATIVTAPILRGTDASVNPWATHADSAKLLIVGTALFGLAAAVRRTA